MYREMGAARKIAIRLKRAWMLEQRLAVGIRALQKSLPRLQVLNKSYNKRYADDISKDIEEVPIVPLVLKSSNDGGILYYAAL